MFTKVVEVSENEKYSQVIENLNGISASTTGLIESCIADLENTNSEIEKERKSINAVIENLKAKETMLTGIFNANDNLILKLKKAFEEEPA